MNKRTTKALKDLHLELRRVGSINESDRELVEKLQDDVQVLLGGSKGVSASAHQSLLGRLGDATQRFEVTHPDLTAVIARVVDTLSNSGI